MGGLESPHRQISRKNVKIRNKFTHTVLFIV